MQIRELESTIGEDLFLRTGRQFQLTELGSITLQYANEIFALGQELNEALSRKAVLRYEKLVIGVADVLSKQIAFRFIQPVLDTQRNLRVICLEGPKEKLLADLAIHKLDVVLMDGPIPPAVGVRAYNHELGSSEVVFMAKAALATRLKKRFPFSLDGAPMLLPSEGTVLRHDLEIWFEKIRITPEIKGEFDDTALLQTFGRAGVGVIPVPSIIADETRQQHKVRIIGTAQGVRERYYAISIDRKINNAAVATICKKPH